MRFLNYERAIARVLTTACGFVRSSEGKFASVSRRFRGSRREGGRVRMPSARRLQIYRSVLTGTTSSSRTHGLHVSDIIASRAPSHEKRRKDPLEICMDSSEQAAERALTKGAMCESSSAFSCPAKPGCRDEVWKIAGDRGRDLRVGAGREAGSHRS